MSKDAQINNALDKALGNPTEKSVDKKPTVKKVRTTNEVVNVSTKKLIIEDGRELLT